MEFTGDELLSVLRETTALVKFIEGERTLGRVTPSQALAMAESGQFTGYGSLKRIRHVRYTPAKMTPAKQFLIQIRETPAYDPTFFRTFAGYLKDQSSSKGKRVE